MYIQVHTLKSRRTGHLQASLDFQRQRLVIRGADNNLDVTTLLSLRPFNWPPSTWGPQVLILERKRQLPWPATLKTWLTHMSHSQLFRQATDHGLPTSRVKQQSSTLLLQQRQCCFPPWLNQTLTLLPTCARWTLLLTSTRSICFLESFNFTAIYFPSCTEHFQSPNHIADEMSQPPCQMSKHPLTQCLSGKYRA